MEGWDTARALRRGKLACANRACGGWKSSELHAALNAPMRDARAKGCQHDLSSRMLRLPRIESEHASPPVKLSPS